MLSHLTIEQGIGEWVVVRTYSAGVHYGRLYRRDGKECVLTHARRIWKWEGANSLHQVCLDGPTGGMISVVLPWALLTEVIEYLPLMEGARARLDALEWRQ